MHFINPSLPIARNGRRFSRAKQNAQFAASVLETRLNEVLRFTLGRTYGVSVQDSFVSAPPMLRPDQPLPGTVMVRERCLCTAFRDAIGCDVARWPDGSVLTSECCVGLAALNSHVFSVALNISMCFFPQRKLAHPL